MKKFLVENEGQAEFLKWCIKEHFTDGFWADAKPKFHADQWKDVSIEITKNSDLGAVDWKPSRNYNFVNPDFLKIEQTNIINIFQCVLKDENLSLKDIRKELIHLSQIIGGRLKKKEERATKLNRSKNGIIFNAHINQTIRKFPVTWA